MNHKTNRTIKKLMLNQFTFPSLIILNVKGLNCPIKRQSKVAEWIKKIQLYGGYKSLTLDLWTHIS